MTRPIVTAALLFGAAAWAADKPTALDERTKALVEGRLPDDPARPLVQGKCMLCHTAEYVTQQRLTAGQWQKTVEKMRKFGTPATDEEAKIITDYLARNWTTDLAPLRAVRTPPPRGSIPGK